MSKDIGFLNRQSLEQFLAYRKLNRQYRVLPQTSSRPAYSFLTIDTLHQCGLFVTTDGQVLARCYYQQVSSMLCHDGVCFSGPQFRVHFLSCTVLWVLTIHSAMYPLLWYHAEQLHGPRNPLYSIPSPPSPDPWQPLIFLLSL